MNVEPSLSPWWDLTTAGPGAGDVSPWWGASSPGDPSTAGPGSGGASGRSEADIATLINVIIRPLLIGFGTVGNVVSFVVLRRGELRKSSTCAYLSLLALVDTGYLWSGCFTMWLGYVSNWSVLAYSWFGGFSCKIWYYTMYGFAHISTSTLTLTALERFISIFFPFHAKHICNVTITRRILLGLVLVFVVFEAQLFFVIDAVRDGSGAIVDCGPAASAPNYFTIYNHMDSVLYSYLPLTVMFVCNIAIVAKLLRAKFSSDKSSANTLSKGARRITAMLVSVSAFFVVCTLPFAVLFQLHISRSTYSYAAILLLMYTNHSLNIIIYTVTNSQFRREIWRLFGLAGRGSVHPETTGTHTDTGGRSPTAPDP